LSEKSIDRISQNESIAPALVSRVAKVISNIDNTIEDTDKAFENIIDC